MRSLISATCSESAIFDPPCRAHCGRLMSQRASEAPRGRAWVHSCQMVSRIYSTALSGQALMYVAASAPALLDNEDGTAGELETKEVRSTRIPFSTPVLVFVCQTSRRRRAYCSRTTDPRPGSFFEGARIVLKRRVPGSRCEP